MELTAEPVWELCLRSADFFYYLKWVSEGIKKKVGGNLNGGITNHIIVVRNRPNHSFVNILHLNQRWILFLFSHEHSHVVSFFNNLPNGNCDCCKQLGYTQF